MMFREQAYLWWVDFRLTKVTFEFSAPILLIPQSVLSSIKFYAVGDNQHRELPELNDNPFRWTWGTSTARCIRTLC